MQIIPIVPTILLLPSLIKPLLSVVLLLTQERVIENLRDQKEREDRVRMEELELMRKENQLLKDKLSVLQPLKLTQSQPAIAVLSTNQRPDEEVSMDCFDQGNRM